MTRLEFHNLIENRLKQMSEMSTKDRLKVANIIKDTISEFLNIDSSEFESEEFIKIFEMAKNSAIFSATNDYTNLISGAPTTLPNNGYSQVQYSLMMLQSHLRIDTKS